MSRITVRWYGKSFDRAVKRHMGNNLKDMAIYYRDAVRQILSIQGPPRSDPYKPPHREFGNLINSFLWELDRKILTARIGSGMIATEHPYTGAPRLAPYARYLEFGTSSGLFGPIKPRPFMRPALYGNMTDLALIATRPMT
jgi:hypothetical protein